MAGTLNETAVNVSYAASENTTTINVSFIYESTAALTTAALVTNEILAIIKKVPNKPPNGKQNFNLRSCSANQTSGSKTAFTASATYDDKTLPKSGGEKGKGDDPGGGGGRGSCLPPDTETTTTVKAMKDYPISNRCNTPILPTPQIEVTLLQRTKVSYHLGSDTSAAQNELKDGVGKIDQAETERQDRKIGGQMQGKKECPEDAGAPPMPDANGKIDEKNRPCGSLLQAGSIGAIQQGPCGPYHAVTKNFLDGNFSAPGILQAGYAQCDSSGATAHTAVGPDGKLIPIVAMKGIGGIIPWPGQPQKK